jgi:hypothetical protein
MISLDDFKNSLGDYAKRFTDEELERLRQDMYQLADIAFDIWVKEKKGI